MVYRQKRKFKPRRRYRKKSGTRAIWKTIQTLRPERKYLTSSYGTPATGTAITSATATYNLLNGMQQGPDVAQRLGSKVSAKFIETRLTIYTTNGTNDQAKSIRVMMYIDKAPRGTKRNIFGVANPNSTTAIYNYDDRNISKNFKILYDRTFEVNSISVKKRTIVIKRKLNFESDYSRGDTGTISDFENNALYMMIFTDSPEGSCFYWMNYNFTYTDA